MQTVTINSRQARDTFAAVLNQAEQEPVIITRTGQAKNVVLISEQDFNELQQLRASKRKARIKAEIDRLLFVHKDTIEALADR